MKDPHEYFKSMETLLNFIIFSAHVCVIGAGRMGAVVADALHQHGVCWTGLMRLIDSDEVEFKNCPGTPFETLDVGKPKVVALAEKFEQRYPDGQVIAHNATFTREDIPKLVEEAPNLDCLILAFDDFPLMLEIAAACYPHCPVVTGFFGERCNHGLIAFSLPNVTPPITNILGDQEREAIHGAQALGLHTQQVALLAADVVLSILHGNQPTPVLLPVYTNAPMIVTNIHSNQFLFTSEPANRVRATYQIEVTND